ncbi:MAG: hypothetical protein QF830_07215 [Rhodospirillales bacterium]|nr:hypothetical protein [Rhodospirillales bacterium]MDP6883907.1 hypothetical protein [Rhodospirillales bacterium]
MITPPPFVRSCRPWTGLALGALIVLGACEAVISQARHYGTDVIGRFQYAGAGRDFTAVIVGNPFSVPDETLGRIVTDAMQEHHFGAATRFTTTPSANARRKFRMVMMFDPPVSLAGDTLCGDVAALPPPRADGRLRLLAAFCAGAYLESEVAASMPRAATPDAPAFNAMIGAVMRDLLPTRDPGEEDDCNIVPCQ